MKLLCSTAEATLRRWFETGISYNLMLGREEDREGLDEFEISLNHIDATRRIYASSLINQAYLPSVDIGEIILKLQPLLGRDTGKVVGNLYCITHNAPHWSWELLTNSKRTILSPENMLNAYYIVRKQLDMNRSFDNEIDVIHPTLKALCDLERKRKLTSHLVSFYDKHNSDGSTSCRLYAHGYFKEKHEGVHRHILEIARELSLGNDPLDKAQFALLNGKKYSQWDSTLQAILCYCKRITPQNFVKHSRDMVPREYLYTVRDANPIKNQLDQLFKRQSALIRFIRPLDSDYSQNNTHDPFSHLDSGLVRKMVLSHYIMFYLSRLHHLSWSMELRECRDALKKCFPKRDDFQKAWSHINGSRGNLVCDISLYERILQLFKSDPIGLPYWAYETDVIPEPLTLLEEYFGTVNQLDERYLDRLNRKHFNIALNIPKLLKIDTSAWLKPPVMLRLGEPLIIHGFSELPLSERLRLAGLVKSKEYVYQTLTENLTMSLESLERLLMGICYHWHIRMNDDISLSRFHKHLSQYSVPEVSPRTLSNRSNLAKKWLKQWPDLGLFHRCL
ncbi:hypothetical protein [Photobacterium lucens]|uniref:hypothetical protein n=1 Tax=Photobacterium lucens TaxID=2562949 RepID=UPI001367B3B2|nr:hypothetical protein [Photobacterium lucens]MBP2700053.1 hypothetical protein [Vibrio parahaemolyticus]MZG56516.1 hypothetical protein [Photobacterium lucens]MZG80365.1 hypothetical protein [Photobacterium lucens]